MYAVSAYGSCACVTQNSQPRPGQARGGQKELERVLKTQYALSVLRKGQLLPRHLQHQSQSIPQPRQERLYLRMHGFLHLMRMLQVVEAAAHPPRQLHTNILRVQVRQWRAEAEMKKTKTKKNQVQKDCE